MKVSILLKDTEKLERKLMALSQIRWESVVQLNMEQIRDRAKVRGWTPVGKTKQLIGSAYMPDNNTVAYTAEYAKFVERGHLTRNHRSYVPGQYYLRRNVDHQRPLFLKSLKHELEKA